MLDEFSRIIYGNIYTNESFDADYQKLCLLNHIDKSLIHTLNLYEVYKACNISTVIFKKLFFNGTRLYGEPACNFSYNLIRFLESVLPQECTSNILTFCKQFESVFRVAQNTLFNDYIMICLGLFLFSFHNNFLDLSQTAEKEQNAKIFMEQSDNFIGQINELAEHFFCEFMDKLSLSLYDFKNELNQELNTIISSQMYNPTLLPIYQLLLEATKNL